MAMHSSEQDYQGPAIFSYGFRPFFFFGALWAALAAPLWAVSYLTGDEILALNTGIIWHAHEMIFGYSSAIIAGFLLTAVPSWTGRPPVKGLSLAALVGLWIAGRIGLLCYPDPVWLGPAIESTFLIVLAGLILREVMAADNKRNAKIAIILSVFALANIGFHVAQILGYFTFSQTTKAGLGVVLLLIVIIGGRIIPTFTGNWLAKRGFGRPPSFNRFDMVVTALSAAAIIAWVIDPATPLCGVLMLLSGGLNLIRLLRWRFWQTFSEALILILHVGYGWVAAAFILIGAATLWPETVPPISGIHAVGTGVIGVMTLAIMTRATLGHSGRDLHANHITVLIFIFINIAAVSRILTPFVPADIQPHFTVVAAGCWCLAFLIFCAAYGRYLWRRAA